MIDHDRSSTWDKHGGHSFLTIQNNSPVLDETVHNFERLCSRDASLVKS